MEQGRYISHAPCHVCGSSDARAVYEKDGVFDSYCWACEKHFSPKDTPENKGAIPSVTSSQPRDDHETVEGISTYPSKELVDRGISKEVAEHFGVRVGFNESSGEVDTHYYPYYRDGQLVAYKRRTIQGKQFKTIGAMKGGVELFGQHLVGDKGKMLVLTEGECDAMAAYQMFKERGKNYKVVSIPNGANISSIKNHLEWLEGFDSVMICFDQDEPGRKAASQAAELLSPGKAKIMQFKLKDANEMLNHGKVNEFFQALFSAKEQHPAGIVSGTDTWDLIINRPTERGVAYPWEGLNQKMYGMRLGELDTFTSGSGMGKTQMLRELQHHILKNTDYNIGIIALEEPIEDSVEALMGLELNKRINLPDIREQTSVEDLRAAWEATSGSGRLHFFDHFGSIDEEGLISKIRYMARGLDCKYIFLDHLSIVISEFASEGGERERIDTAMTKLKKLTQELNIWIGLVVHLRKTSGGKSFEEGAMPSLDDLRGSGAIKQLSNGVIAIGRNQQHQDPTLRNVSQVRTLKCRLTGRTGDADKLLFDEDTGRMVPYEDDFDINEDEVF